MERKRRLALWFLSAVLVAAMSYQGRRAFNECPPAALSRFNDRENIVRLKGCMPVTGILRVPEHGNIETVINMTAPFLAGRITNPAILKRELRNGDIVVAAPKGEQLFEISIDRMKAKERMLLGIPLEPDFMDLADWESLPGIGPVLAKTIMDDRHKNGAFGNVESLSRVPGIGEKRLRELKKYF